MVKLYVEGGGDTNTLKTACRKGFTAFITNAGVERRPRIVACGSRRDAYESYCTAVANGEDALLLVDSEAAVETAHQSPQDKPEEWQSWTHLKHRDGDSWDKPDGAFDTDCHLMVQCMESWFLADRDTLRAFFGQGFKENRLPAPGNAVETIPKEQVYNSLAAATRGCTTKTQYGKGEHSFQLLEKTVSTRVTAASPWAKRFVEETNKKMGA